LALLRRQAADRSAHVLRDGSAIVDRRFNHANPSLRQLITKPDPKRRRCNKNYEVDKCCIFGTTMTTGPPCPAQARRRAPTVGRTRWTRCRPPTFQRLRSQSNE